MKFINIILLSLGLLVMSAQSAQAVLMIASGNTVDFIYETDNIDPLFGTLQVSGDSVFVLPLGFNASSTDGVGAHTGTQTDLVNALGTIQVVAKDGYDFSGITIVERGSYSISGSSSVDMGASMHLFDWANPVLGSVENTTLTSLSDFSLNDGMVHNWSASGSFDLTTATWDGIRNVGLTLDNLLTATSLSIGDSAFIDKSSVGGVGITFETAPVVVPVPAAIWLFGSGLLGLIVTTRRKA